MKVIIGVIVGLVLGVGATLIANQFVQVSYIPDEFEYADLLSFESTRIEDVNFHCDDEFSKTVGGVLGAIYHANSNGYVNRISESCGLGLCQITYSNCKPWQSDSCGSTSLLFKVNDNGKINRESFQCVQVP